MKNTYLKLINLIILLVLLTACCGEKTTPKTYYTNNSGRIKLIEDTLINRMYRYIIIKVDSTEYLVNDQGGIIELK
jgi:hypothetical protein